jgi:hypothetical protein
MPKLSDIQSLLLSHASRQPRGSLYPLPETVGDAARTKQPVAALLRRGFVEEREVAQPADAARIDGDLSYGLYLTPAGAKAIAVEPDDLQDVAASVRTAAGEAPARDKSKISGVVDLLSRIDGASVAELIEATGWLPHTTRAALTGLRRKGHQIEKARVGEITRYRIIAVSA